MSVAGVRRGDTGRTGRRAGGSGHAEARYRPHRRPFLDRGSYRQGYDAGGGTPHLRHGYDGWRQHRDTLRIAARYAPAGGAQAGASQTVRTDLVRCGDLRAGALSGALRRQEYHRYALFAGASAHRGRYLSGRYPEEYRL